MHDDVRVCNLHLYNAAKGIIPGPVRSHGQARLEMDAFLFDKISAIKPELPLVEEGETGHCCGMGELTW
jgi:hypothetical protein